MSEAKAARRTRKDAQANRVQILEVARSALTSGRDVSMDAIAKQAGVGSGTLYRHFPNKDALLAALLDAHHDDLGRQRAAIEAEELHAGRRFERWIDALGDWLLAYDGMLESMRDAWLRTNSPLTPSCQHAIDATECFLRAAQEQGLAREGLTGKDMFLGALAIAWASGAPTAENDTRQVMREVLRNGWALTVKAST